MKARLKKYIKLNIVSLVFIAVSSISVTLAWFAYSGLANVATEIGVKAWYIELQKDGKSVSNDVVITLSEIYPGMDIIDEKIIIKNLGDSDAQINYSIISARILGEEKDNYFIDETVESSYVEDLLSHEYPFHINMNLSKNYVLSKGQDSVFEVSISWPLDSNDDEMDSYWGTESFKFQQNEEALKVITPEYQIRSAIQIVISISAEQYLESDTSSDTNYNLGDIIFFDVVNNVPCIEGNPSCLKTYVLDVNNTLLDTTITLLPNPIDAYISSTFNDYIASQNTLVNGWTVSNRPLVVEDLIKIVSKDVTNSLIVRQNMSDTIIGNVNYTNRLEALKIKTINNNGYYKFLNEYFGYLSSDTCYWINTEYDINNGFALSKIDELHSKIYKESKTTSCKVIPIITVTKTI